MATIKLSLTIDGPVTASAIRNAVRRSLTDAEVTGPKGEVKGLKYRVSESTPKGVASEVRAWAREVGIPVGERGRIDRDVYEQYAVARAAATAE